MENTTQNSIVKVDPSTESITIQGSGGIVTTPRTIYNALVRNDFGNADDALKASAIQAVCGALGVSPMPAPFAFIQVQGKTKMYPTAELFEMLAQRHGLEVVAERENYDERTQTYIVHGTCKSKDGRKTSAMAALHIPKAAIGEAYANGIMKCHTKFKRRAVKGHVGLTIPGWDADDALDDIAETEPINRADLIKAFHATANAVKWFAAETKEAEQAKRHEFYARVLGREVSDFSEVTDVEVQKLLEALQMEIHASAPEADSLEQQAIDAEYTETSPEPAKDDPTLPMALQDDPTATASPEVAEATTSIGRGVYETMVEKAKTIGIDVSMAEHRHSWAKRAGLVKKDMGGEEFFTEPKWIETGNFDDFKRVDSVNVLGTWLAQRIAEIESQKVGVTT